MKQMTEENRKLVADKITELQELVMSFLPHRDKMEEDEDLPALMVFCAMPEIETRTEEGIRYNNVNALVGSNLDLMMTLDRVVEDDNGGFARLFLKVAKKHLLKDMLGGVLEEVLELNREEDDS